MKEYKDRWNKPLVNKPSIGNSEKNKQCENCTFSKIDGKLLFHCVTCNLETLYKGKNAKNKYF